MRNKLIHAFLLLTTALCLTASPVLGQTVKTVSVSEGKSYTDHVALAEDSRDTDLMVKFIFDEKKNTLTVSLLSYRRLFVFRESARYSQVVLGRRLLPDRLPYVADFDKHARFYLSKQLRRSLPVPRRKHIFRRWLEYDGIQPVPSDYHMVNDYIEQQFDIQGKRTSVTVTLRDIFLLDGGENKTSCYTLSQGRDLNLIYKVSIVRNPCFGLDEEIDAARKACLEVKKAYQVFQKSCPGGKVSSEDALESFNKTRTYLLTRYVRRDEQLACPDLREAVQQYNHYVDSIGTLKCELQLPEDVSWDDGKPLDTKLLFTQTRQLDKAVARWLVSKDELERKDLVEQCQDIIKDVSAMIRQHKVSTPEEKQAVQAFNQAEHYFRKTCK